MLADKKILLIISGGIAAYKSLDLIRRLRERQVGVVPVLTRAAEEFRDAAYRVGAGGRQGLS